MALETTTDVDEMARVQDEGGNQVPPSSADFRHQAGENVDVNAETEEVDVTAPDRADTVTIHVVTSGAAHVELQFHAQSDYSGEHTQRDQNDLGNYSVAGAGDIFVTADVASPYLRIRIVDDSDAANSVDYNIYVR